MAQQCSQCETHLEEGAAVCLSCGASADMAAAVPFLPAPMFSAVDRDLVGIGGWLILPAIGLAVSPFRSAHGIFIDSKVLFSGQFQTVLATRSGFAEVLMFELINNSALLIAAAILNILLYRKKKVFPTLMVIFLVGNAILMLADHLMVIHLALQTDSGDLIRSIAGCAIWIPYFFLSRRVKLTFVN